MEPIPPLPRPRVLFVGSAVHRPDDVTSRRKFEALAQVIDSSVIGFAPGWLPRVPTEPVRMVLLPRLPLPPLRQATFFLFAPLATAWALVRGRADVIVAQSPYEGAAAAAGATLARLVGRRAALVVESHGDFEESAFLQRKVPLARAYRAAMHRAARYALRRAHALRAVSSSTRAQLEALALGKPCVVFPAWTDIDVFLRTGERRSSPPAQPTIAFVGTLSFIKGIDVLLDALPSVWAAAPDARVLLIGPAGDPSYVRTIRERVDALRKAGHLIEIVGVLPQDELATRLSESSILVLPSRSEALGRVALEAMAIGLPVVASRVGGIPDIVAEGETGLLVAPEDPHALGGALAALCTDTKRAEAFGAEGRRRARSLFTPALYSNAYRALVDTARREEAKRRAR